MIRLLAIRHFLLVFGFLIFRSNVSFGQDEEKEFLRWDCVVVGYRPNLNYPGHGAYDILLQRVSYWKDTLMLWKREVPEHMKGITGFYVLGTEGSYKTGETIPNIGRDTEPYLIDFYICDDVFLSNEAGVTSQAGFLLFDKQDGSLLIEQLYPVVEEIEDNYFTPETEISIKTGHLKCSLISICR